MKLFKEDSRRSSRIVRTVCGLLGVCSVFSSVGCQVDMAGQTLPSPYYMSDDVQYFAPGPEFKLQREAAAMQQHAQPTP